MTKEEALQKLSEAIQRCREAGIEIFVAPIYGEVHTVTSIMLQDVVYEDWRLTSKK